MTYFRCTQLTKAYRDINVKMSFLQKRIALHNPMSRNKLVKEVKVMKNETKAEVAIGAKIFH